MKLSKLIETPENNVDAVKMLTAHLHINTDLKSVNVTTIRYKHSLQKQCFNNSYRYLIDHYSDSNRYVLGYVFFYGIPIEHAWVKLDDKSFDVTLDATKQDSYISVIELSMAELLEFVEKHEYAPSIYDYNRFKK